MTTTATLPASERRLSGEVITVARLSDVDRRKMFELMNRFYFGASWDLFGRDLDEKRTCILLRNAETRQIRGFTTMTLLETDVDGQVATVLFSGDTIVDPNYWGETQLVRCWGRHVFELFCGLKKQGRPLYWFLISSGYKTYRFLPIFFREFYPNHRQPTPPDMQRCLDKLARARYGDAYDADRGIIELAHPTPLRPGVADVNERDLRDRHVAYFLERNPGHIHGDELACLTEIRDDNLTRAAQRVLKSM